MASKEAETLCGLQLVSEGNFTNPKRRNEHKTRIVESGCDKAFALHCAGWHSTDAVTILVPGSDSSWDSKWDVVCLELLPSKRHFNCVLFVVGILRAHTVVCNLCLSDVTLLLTQRNTVCFSSTGTLLIL